MPQRPKTRQTDSRERMSGAGTFQDLDSTTMASGGGQQLGSLNRRLRNICEREGMDYGEDAVEEDDLVRRFRVATQLASKNIRTIMADIKAAKTVDLCFLIDGTSSMLPHIEGVRDSVYKVVNTLLRSQQSPAGVERLRLAVVVYRDFDNPAPLEVFRFSERSEECVSFCKDVRAVSGAKHDPPEDVLGGLEAATRLDWSGEAGSKIVFHMGDSPCHGRQYHASGMRDNYPDGDPKGRTSAGLFKRIRELGIDYYFGRICRHTDQMIDQFCKDYGRFIKTFGVEEIANIAGSVIASVSATVEENVQKSKLGGGTGLARLRQFQLVAAVPAWDQLPVQQGSYLQYDLPDSVEDVVDDKPLAEKKVFNVRVKVAPNPFAEGSERIAYYGQDLFEGYGRDRSRGRSVTRKDQRRGGSASARGQSAAATGAAGPTGIVLKEYKHLGNKQNTLERYMSACEAQTVAFYLADQFNDAVRSSAKAGAGDSAAAPIKFLKIKVLLLSQAGGLRIMSCERRFLGDTKFVKFTNNCAYSVQLATEAARRCGLDPAMVDTMMAFSHWTYQRSNCFLMVVDLQGCICTDSSSSTSKLLMTDPAIHCRDLIRYAPLNLGRQGMQAFFDGHRCGELCESLGLRAVAKV